MNPQAGNPGGDTREKLAICEKLRRTEIGRTNYGGVLAGAFHAMPINRDGPEAADTIEALVEALEGLLEGLGPDGYVLPAGAIATAQARAALSRARANPEEKPNDL